MDDQGRIEKRVSEEIRVIRRRFRAVFRERPDIAEAPSTWALAADGLRWLVVVEGVLEPDLDVEFDQRALVVRGLDARDARLLCCVLPVPEGFDADCVHFRFSDDCLEVRIARQP